MPERDRLIETFLAAHGHGGARRSALAGDASFRRYERIKSDNGTAVLMDAPPPKEDVRPFMRVAEHLAGLGLSAPTVLAADPDHGFLLLEDLGDSTYTLALDGDGDETTLYALAVDLLIDLHRRPPTEVIPRGLPPYGSGRLLDEAFLLPRWTMPALTGEPVAEKTRHAYGEAWLSLFPIVHAQPKTLVLRDYHVDNLIWLPEREGVRACGLLDFQDAVSGPGAYDLMSLLEDARRDIPAELVADMTERYLAAFPQLDRAAFADAFAILAAQRHAKVIGIFTRLCRRDGKPDYLVHIPRVWRLLERALENPVLGPVRDWFDTHLPPDLRRVPPAEDAGR